MAKKPRTPSPLLEAAQAFDDALAAYAQLGDLFVKSPLTSTKHLERANQTLGEIGATEEKLAAAGQRLAQEIAAARDRQEALARAMVERLPAVRERNEALAALLAELRGLGAEATAVHQTAGITPPEVLARTEELAARAGEIAGRAREAQFEELATQAHALHQQLLAAVRKLQAATLR